MKVSDIMNRDVHVVHPDDALRGATTALRSQGADLLPVVDQGQVVGSLSKYDVVNFGREYGLATGSQPVSSAMNPHPATCSVDLDVLDAEQRIRDDVSTLIVVDDSGMVAGTLAVPSLCKEVGRARGPVTGSVHGGSPSTTIEDDRVDFESEESFPASDPPPHQLPRHQDRNTV